MEPFIGEMRWVAFPSAPDGWMQCDGQLLKIADYVALFSLIGTTYGGDGNTTFALPAMAGRTLIGAGWDIDVGKKGGEEKHTLIPSELGTHTHPMMATTAAATSSSPSGVLGGAPIYSNQHPSTITSQSTTAAGAGQPHDNMQPFIALRCIIRVNGYFPTRP